MKLSNYKWNIYIWNHWWVAFKVNDIDNFSIIHDGYETRVDTINNCKRFILNNGIKNYVIRET